MTGWFFFSPSLYLIHVDARTSNFGVKRNTARAGFSSDSYDDVSYPKRSNLGTGRSWAEETEDLDIYGNNSSLGYGTGGYGHEAGDYADDSAYDSLYAARFVLKKKILMCIHS